MNILALNYEYPPLGGGGGVVFKDIMEALAERHHITVVTSMYRGLPRYEVDGNLRIHRVPVLLRRALSTASMPSLLSYWPSSWWCGRKLIRGSRFDLINSHFAVPSSPSADELSRQFQIPHVLSVHGGDIFDPSKKTSPHRLPMVRGLVRKLLNRADRVVAQSNNTRENAQQLYGVSREIDVIPLGIRPISAPVVDRAELGIERDRFVMVTIGRLVSRKRVDDLLQVLAILDDPRDLLVVVGDGPKLAEWQALARDLGVAERVRFAGYVSQEEKSKLLAGADVFASTSQHEGFGLVFLEAMEHGLPVVAYDHGGQTDFLTDGETGALIPLGDRHEFAAALKRLKTLTEFRETCGRHNRQLVQEFYVSRCADRYEDLFARVIVERNVQQPVLQSQTSAGRTQTPVSADRKT